MLRCSVIEQAATSIPFYLMVDCRERGAVFVFRAASGENLKLHARVTKIGAILYPQGPKEVQICTNDALNGQEEELVWHSKSRIPTIKRRDQKKSRKKNNMNKNGASPGDEDCTKTRKLSDIYKDPRSLQKM